MKQFLSDDDFTVYEAAHVANGFTAQRNPLVGLDEDERVRFAGQYDLSLRAVAMALLATLKENFRAGRDPWATWRVDYRPAHPENQSELFAYYAEGRGRHAVLTHLKRVLVASFIYPDELVKVDVRPCLKRNPFTHAVEFTGMEFELQLRYIRGLQLPQVP